MTRKIAVLGPAELAEALIEGSKAFGFEGTLFETPKDLPLLKNFLKEIQNTGFEFVHPGLSFWADRPEFVKAVHDEGLISVTATHANLHFFGSKLKLFTKAEELGIAHLAYTLEPLSSIKEIESEKEQLKIEYPFIVKPNQSGVQWGVQLIQDERQFKERLPLWITQLRKRTNPTVILEKALAASRHVCLAFVRSSQGEVYFLPSADVSLQSKWRRMIQFYPAEILTPDTLEDLQNKTKQLLDSIQYVGYGSLDFLIDDLQVYLIDGLSRLNASFFALQKLTGRSILELQLAAIGVLPWQDSNSLKDSTPPSHEHQWSYACSARIYAEDPVRAIPTPGVLQEMSASKVWDRGDSWVMFLTARQAPCLIDIEDSGVLGEVFAFGESRKRVIDSLHESLKELWIAGSLQTNQRYLIEHLEHPFVRENLFHAGFSEEDFVPSLFPDAKSRSLMITALHQAILAQKNKDEPLFKWKIHQHWIDPLKEELKWVSGPHLFETPQNGYKGTIEVNHQQHRFCAYPLSASHLNSQSQNLQWRIQWGEWSVQAFQVFFPREGLPPPNTEKRMLALTSGVIRSLLGRVGDVFEAHETVLILESLGVLVPHATPLRIRLKEWKVAEGDRVSVGDELAVLEWIS